MTICCAFEISSYPYEGIKIPHLEKKTFIRRFIMEDEIIQKVVNALKRELPEVVRISALASYPSFTFAWVPDP
jgi:hypothetical protein